MESKILVDAVGAIFLNMLRSYKADVRGNFSIMFAIGSLMLILALSVAVDYSGMVSKRTKLQDVADMALLAAVKSGQVKEKDIQVFVDQFAAEMGYENINLTIKLTQDNTIIVDAQDDYKMFLLGAFFDDRAAIGAAAEAPLPGEAEVNMALVLDTTGSMQGSRIQALREASESLIAELKEANKNGQDNVNLSLVPFSNYVRISTDFKSASWLDLQPDGDFTWRVLDGDN